MARLLATNKESAMTTETIDAISPGRSKDIATTLLQLGATSYGGPAIMGIMQTELQERRKWVSKERFLEGLAVANMVPGATATQLGIFLAYARGGFWGGLLGGICFVLPAFLVMLVLTIAYVHLGVTPLGRQALYGLGPVVIGLFAVALYRLGRTAARSVLDATVGLAAAVAAAATHLGIVAILVLAGCAGALLFYRGQSRARVRSIAGFLVLAVLAAAWWASTSPSSSSGAGWTPNPASLVDLGLYFLKVGAFTIGGGLTMIAFIQDQVVGQFGWLTPREFVDGLALGQLTPGPVLMIAAYVGYKLVGVAGAVVAAAAAFLPSFVIMLAILPVLDRVRKLAWVTAAMKGMGPAVIGVLAVSLIRLSPAAVPDPVALALLIGTVVAALAFRVGAFKLMIGGALLGVLRSRLPLIVP
jgi:chromate transporter